MGFALRRAMFTTFFHITSECLQKVEEYLELEDGLLGAECWLGFADRAFKETLFWSEKQKPYPKGSKAKKMDKADIAGLMGNLEGARAVIQEKLKK